MHSRPCRHQQRSSGGLGRSWNSGRRDSASSKRAGCSLRKLLMPQALRKGEVHRGCLCRGHPPITIRARAAAHTKWRPTWGWHRARRARGRSNTRQYAAGCRGHYSTGSGSDATCPMMALTCQLGPDRPLSRLGCDLTQLPANVRAR